MGCPPPGVQGAGPRKREGGSTPFVENFVNEGLMIPHFFRVVKGLLSLGYA